MHRVSRKRLENLVAEVARLQSRPTQPHKERKSQVGALSLDHNPCYGGWDLVEYTNEHGGENSLIGNTFAGRGRLNTHEMETFLLGMIAGMEGSHYWKMPRPAQAPRGWEAVEA